MAHGVSSSVKRGSGPLSARSEGKGIGSRRIFAPQFKLQVLDSYRNDVDCKGNQRATARKYGIHRRQIQKWLQVENNLRNSVIKGSANQTSISGVNGASAVCANNNNNNNQIDSPVNNPCPEARKCIELALRLSDHGRQQDDLSSPDNSGAEPDVSARVIGGGPVGEVPAVMDRPDKRVPDIPQYWTHERAYATSAHPSSPHKPDAPLDFSQPRRSESPCLCPSAALDLSLKKPYAYLRIGTPAYTALIHSEPPPLPRPSPSPARPPTPRDPQIWDLSTKGVKRPHQDDFPNHTNNNNKIKPHDDNNFPINHLKRLPDYANPTKNTQDNPQPIKTPKDNYSNTTIINRTQDQDSYIVPDDESYTNLIKRPQDQEEYRNHMKRPQDQEFIAHIKNPPEEEYANHIRRPQEEEYIKHHIKRLRKEEYTNHIRTSQEEEYSKSHIVNKRTQEEEFSNNQEEEYGNRISNNKRLQNDEYTNHRDKDYNIKSRIKKEYIQEEEYTHLKIPQEDEYIHIKRQEEEYESHMIKRPRVDLPMKKTRLEIYSSNTKKNTDDDLSNPVSSTSEPVKPIKLFKPYLLDHDSNSNSSTSPTRSPDISSNISIDQQRTSPIHPSEYTATTNVITLPYPDESYYYNNNNDYSYYKDDYPNHIQNLYCPNGDYYQGVHCLYDEKNSSYLLKKNSNLMKQRQSYSLDFKLSAIQCYYSDAVCKGNQRAVATKYKIHRRQVQKWLKQEDQLRQRIETHKQLSIVR